MPTARKQHVGFLNEVELAFFETELIGGSYLLKESNPCLLSGFNSYLPSPGNPSDLFCAHLNKLEEESSYEEESLIEYLREEDEADFLEIPMFDVAKSFMKKIVHRQKKRNQLKAHLLQTTETADSILQLDYKKLK